MIVLIILIFVFLLATFLILPYWWWLLHVPFFLCLAAARSSKQALLSSAVSAGLLWFGYSFYLYRTSADLITQRISAMFNLPYPYWLILLTGLFAAVVAAVAGWTGYSLRALLFSKRTV